jgi:hypothetical protein
MGYMTGESVFDSGEADVFLIVSSSPVLGPIQLQHGGCWGMA